MKTIGFIGFGRRAKTICGFISNNTKIEIIGVFDQYLNQNECLPYVFFKKANDLLKKRPDVVFIATPPSYHFKYIKLCEKYGVPVICEKPLASSLEEIKKIEKVKTKIYTAYQLIYDPLIKKMFNIVSNNKILSVSASQRVKVKLDGWKKDIKISGGGTLIDNASHLINLGIYNFGLPKQVFGSFNLIENKIEKQCDVVMFYKSFQYKIHTDWMSSVSKENKIEINTDNFDVRFIEDNRKKELSVIYQSTEDGWSVQNHKFYYIPKGLERDINIDPKNQMADKKDLDIMLDNFIDDMNIKNSEEYKKNFFCSEHTNKIVHQIYKNNNKVFKYEI